MSRAVCSSVPPLTRRMGFLDGVDGGGSDADWCPHSDAVPDSCVSRSTASFSSGTARVAGRSWTGGSRWESRTAGRPASTSSAAGNTMTRAGGLYVCSLSSSFPPFLFLFLVLFLVLFLFLILVLFLFLVLLALVPVSSAALAMLERLPKIDEDLCAHMSTRSARPSATRSLKQRRGSIILLRERK